MSFSVQDYKIHDLAYVFIWFESIHQSIKIDSRKNNDQLWGKFFHTKICPINFCIFKNPLMYTVENVLTISNIPKNDWIKAKS